MHAVKEHAVKDKLPALAPLVLTVAAVAVTGWFVGETARTAWGQLVAAGPRLDWRLLGLAGVVYLIALAPMAWYWRRVVAAIDRPVDWGPLLAAYYAGHLGKYVPGKAMVVVLRTAMLRSDNRDTGRLAVSVLVETLTMMATGGAIAAGLLLAGIAKGSDSNWLLVVAVAVAGVAAAPTLPPLLRLIIQRVSKTNEPAKRLSWRLTAVGWLAAGTTWIGLAASLWLIIAGCGGEAPLSLATGRVVLLATTLPYVAGFLSLIPGGFVVRDALMLQLLAGTVGSGAALAAAAAARLVWIAAELGIYGILVGVRRVGATRRSNAHTADAE